MRSLLFSSLHSSPSPSPSHSPSSHSSPSLCSCQPGKSASSKTATSSSKPATAGTRAARSSGSPTSVTTTSSLSRHAAPANLDAAVTANIPASAAAFAAAATACSSQLHAAMAKRGRAKRHLSPAATASQSPASPPGATAGLCRPTTPSSPVEIPGRHAHAKRQHATHRRSHPCDAHAPEAIPPSLAALLAVTDIPRQTRRRRRRAPDHPLTVDELVTEPHVSEKELSLTLSRGPLDLLLSPPDGDDGDGDLLGVEANFRSVLARTTSNDSIPSLGGDSFTTDTVSSLETLASSQPRRHSPARRSFEPVRSPSDATDEHPLSAGLDDSRPVRLCEPPADDEAAKAVQQQFLEPLRPLTSTFKSNLTASLRALRSAARSFSTINFPSIPPDDLLTRSILTIDPKVPYADERRPPVTEEMPSAELRRYLNPTTSRHGDPQPKPARAYSASIQMQTYKFQRSRSPQSPLPPRGPSPWASPPHSASATGPGHQHPARPGGASTPVPGMRQREMRENSDFIRIAVMEMAMRRRGKLDSQRPGRARWALPPRRTPTKPYEIGANGVPVRWTPVSD